MYRWQGLADVPRRLGQVRRHHRQLRRRPPRAPRASLAPRRAAVAAERGLPRGRGHLRPAPDGRAAARARTRVLLHRRSTRGPSCWAGPGADAVLRPAVHRESRSWSPEEFVERVLVDRAARRGRRGRRELPVRPPGRRRRGHCSRELGREVRLRGRGHRPARRRRDHVGPRRTSGDLLADGDVARRRGGARPAVRGRGRGRRGRPARPRARLPDRQRGPAAATTAIPADGVYAGLAASLAADGRTRPLARPRSASAPTRRSTGAERRVEAYVLDRDDLELYGVQVAVDSWPGCGAWQRSTPSTSWSSRCGGRRPGAPDPVSQAASGCGGRAGLCRELGRHARVPRADPPGAETRRY